MSSCTGKSFYVSGIKVSEATINRDGRAQVVVAGSPGSDHEVSVHQLVEEGWRGQMSLPLYGPDGSSVVTLAFDPEHAFGRGGRSEVRDSLFARPELVGAINLESIKDDDASGYAREVVRTVIDSASAIEDGEHDRGVYEANEARRRSAERVITEQLPGLIKAAPQSAQNAVASALYSDSSPQITAAARLLPALASADAEGCIPLMERAMSCGATDEAVAALGYISIDHPTEAARLIADELQTPLAGRYKRTRAYTVSLAAQLVASNPDAYAHLLPLMAAGATEIDESEDRDHATTAVVSAVRSELERSLVGRRNSTRVTSITVAASLIAEDPGTFGDLLPAMTRGAGEINISPARVEAMTRLEEATLAVMHQPVTSAA